MEKYLRTTTIGDSELVTTARPFQIMSAEETIMKKLSDCDRNCSRI
jgi:hypothetical protein